jgi:hypothetical protein
MRTLTKTQKAEIRNYVAWNYSGRNARNIRIYADGTVTARVDRLPGTNIPGTMIAGYAIDLLCEATSNFR